MEWSNIINELWTHHRGKTIGILIGFLFGLLVVVLGFFEALFIFLCMWGGYFLGRRIDENFDFRDLWDRFNQDR